MQIFLKLAVSEHQGRHTDHTNNNSNSTNKSKDVGKDTNSTRKGSYSRSGGNSYTVISVLKVTLVVSILEEVGTLAELLTMV